MTLKSLIVNHLLSRVYKAFLSVNVENKPFFMIKTDKALVIAPHAGDETLGMGGTIAKYYKNIKVMRLTDKITGAGHLSSKETKQICENEFTEAMKAAQVYDTECLHAKNNEIIYAYNKLLKTDFSYFDYIFIPTPTDNITNYKSLGVLMKRILSEQTVKSTLKVLLYELWAPIPVTSNFVDISDYLETKNQMIKAYKSIPENENVINSINALSQYRKYLSNNKPSEAFLSFDYKNFIKFITTIYV